MSRARRGRARRAAPVGGALGRTAATAVAAAAVARGVTALHRTGHLPGGSARWARTNHRGEPVTLAEGLALAAGTALPLLLVDRPAALAVAGAAVAGAVDDLAGEGSAKGLRGHLSALRQGRVTTGVLKIAVLGTTGLAACAWSDERGARSAVATLSGAALVAGSANLANLFDLRPGRALKVALASGIPLLVAGRAAASTVTGAGLAVLPGDLRGVSMLGDTGANPLGAAVGLAAAQSLGARGRLLALTVVAGLVLASEKVSFSRVIDRTPALRALDRWGRRA